MMGGRHPFQQDTGQDCIWLEGEQPLQNPITFILDNTLSFNHTRSIIHGDLNGFNILVDQHNETWLIDFSKTNMGPLIQDFACLEIFIRLLVDNTTYEQLFAWSLASFDESSKLNMPELPPIVQACFEIRKAHETIFRIRHIALDGRSEDEQIAYLIALLFHAIKIITIMDVAPFSRDHALIIASVIAKRLNTIQKGLKRGMV